MKLLMLRATSIFATLLTLGLCVSGCSTAKSGANVENGQEITQTPQEGPVIVQIVGRDSTITVRAGAAGPTYAVTDHAGQTLVPAVTLEQLHANHPAVARRIDTMNASSASQNTLWAGVE